MKITVTLQSSQWLLKKVSSGIQLIFVFICIIFCLQACTKINDIKVDGRLDAGAASLDALTGRPNVMIILADDMGYEIPAYTGGQSYPTPNIDALAHDGMQFTQCRATPLCSPSRFMLLTGKYFCLS